MPVRVFDESLPNQTKIWQYMKRSKFTQMIETGCIRFATCTELRKDDENECRYPRKIQEILDERDKEYNEKLRLAMVPTAPENVVFYDTRSSIIKRDDHVFIKSWFIGENESSEMWRRYADEKKDVLIQSTVQLLVDSLKNEPRHILADKITYADFESFVHGPRHAIDHAVYKDKSYEIESEFRLFLDLLLNAVTIAHPDTFRLVKTDLILLCEKIIISPKATDEDLQELRKYLREKNVDKPVALSSLST